MKTEKILGEIKNKAKQIKQEIKIMTLCGTHSQTIAQYGLKNILPKNVNLIAGPGCPVCVTNQQDIETILTLARAGIPIAAYGDSAGVPCKTGSLQTAQEQGADINIIYSIEDALKLKQIKTDLVFFGIGFETTAPMSAWAIKNGLCVFSAHKFFPPAMAALLTVKIKIDGFINPGHVSAIIGEKPYKQFKIPQVIAGFEPEDILIATNMILGQIVKNEHELENEYRRAVKPDGNPLAMNLINEVFEPEDAVWRGIGLIKNSGMKIRNKYSKFDAKIKYRHILGKIKNQTPKKSACRCGEILQGLAEPKQCPLFKKICTPENPFGACMVSVEGTCNIEYRYND